MTRGEAKATIPPTRLLTLAVLFAFTHIQAEKPLRIVVFNADATPEIWMPVAPVKARGLERHRQWRLDDQP